MSEQLVNVLQNRRQMAGNGSDPLGFGRFGEIVGVDGSMLFKFTKGQRELKVETLRKLANYAARTNDIELIEALGGYALGVRVSPAADWQLPAIAGQHHAEGAGDVVGFEVEGPAVFAPGIPYPAPPHP
jgi:hypothetical protein